MSAAEMLTFVTYAPIMFGRFVPEGNTYWELFLKIRRILSLLRSKQFDLECLDYLEDLIADHHVHYIQLFGPLKPKHHFMTHYPLIIKKMGPPSHIQSMRSESKHRQQKSTSNSVPTRVNICKTIAIKQQLMVANRLLLNKGFDPGFSTGRLQELSVRTSTTLSEATSEDPNDYLITNSVRVFNTKYKIDFTVAIDVGDEFPIFGQIKEILISHRTDDVIFFLDTYKTISFHEHFFAYEVVKSKKTQFVKQLDLHKYHPVLTYKHCNGKMYVITDCDE